MFRAVKNRAKALLNIHNIVTIKEHNEQYIDMEREFLDIWDQVKSYTMTSIERGYALYKAIHYIINYNIPGDLVECGVWRGGSCMLMAKTLKKLGEIRTIFLYDTFEGMAQPSSGDLDYNNNSAKQEWLNKQKNGICDWCYASLEEVRGNVSLVDYPEDRFVFVKGNVMETIPHTQQTDIALLRVDTDFYDSTRHELIHLYPKITANGILIIDDYGYWKGARKAVDEYFSATKEPFLLSRIDNSGRIGIKI